MAVLTSKSVAAGYGEMTGLTEKQTGIVLGIAARLAWAFIRAHGDDPTPIKILFFRVKYRQLAFLVELLFGPDPDAAPA